jgi:hypothetical protein
VDADDIEAVRVIFCVPALQDAEIANAVDAGVLPEIDQQKVAAIALDRMRNVFPGCACVNPYRVGGEIRSLLEFLRFSVGDGGKEEANENG